MDLSGSPARLSSRTCVGCCCLLPSLQQAAGSRRVRGPFQGDFQFLPEDAPARPGGTPRLRLFLSGALLPVFATRDSLARAELARWLLCCLCGAVYWGADEGVPSTRTWVSRFARGSIPSYVDRRVDAAHNLDRKLLYDSLINTCAFYGKLRLYTLIFSSRWYVRARAGGRRRRGAGRRSSNTIAH